MTALFEPTPRFTGCPPICVYENLPSFQSEKALNDFREKNAPGHSLVKKWLCGKCGCYHYTSNPNQSSSGNPRAFTPNPPRFEMEGVR